MKLIAHRGNTDGEKKSLENSIDYIQDAIDQGFDAEIDVWGKDDSVYLGHDKPQYKCPMSFLISNSSKLWIHCKNLEAMHTLREFESLNFFWHEKDKFTLTSKSFIWTYPGNKACNKSVIVMRNIKEHNGEICFGICADHLK